MIKNDEEYIFSGLLARSRREGQDGFVEQRAPPRVCECSDNRDRKGFVKINLTKVLLAIAFGISFSFTYYSVYIINKAWRRVIVADSSCDGSIPDSFDAGFIPTNSSTGSHLFYWYTPSQDGSKSAPTAIWLNGGPGSSSLIGAFTGLGPYSLSPSSDGGSSTLVKRAMGAWSKNMNLLVVDQPVGTGYSYTMSSNGFANTMDDVARDFVSFLAGFYKIHPELDKYESHLWIMGESYAGKYVPAIATLGLLKHGLANRYRFKGVAIGNGYTEPLPMATTVANSYYALGLIDGNQRDHANARINTCVDLAKASKWGMAADCRAGFMNYITRSAGNANKLDVRVFEPYNFTYIETFMNGPVGRKQFRIPDSVSPRYCVSGCHDVATNLHDDKMKGYAHLLPPILEAGHKVLLYTGQMDLRDGVAATEAWLNHSSFAQLWPFAQEFFSAERQTWSIDMDCDHKNNGVAGFVKTHANLTQAVVVGAGHMVPRDQPVRAQEMISSFVHGTPPFHSK